MFANQQRTEGLSNIIAVAALVALYLTGAGFLWKTYREGGNNGGDGCQVACRQVLAKAPSKG